MLNIRVNDGKNEAQSVIEASGDLLHIVADLGQVIQHMYAGFSQRDPIAAELFRAAVIAVVSPESPAWDVAAAAKRESVTICTTKEVKKDD